MQAFLFGIVLNCYIICFDFYLMYLLLFPRRRIAEKGSTIETEQKEDKNVS